MADITKCSGDGCVMRGDCQRFTSKPVEWQVWFSRPPREDGYCMWIIPTVGGEDASNSVTAA